MFPNRPDIIGSRDAAKAWNRIRQVADLVYRLASLDYPALYIHEVAQDTRDPFVDPEQIKKVQEFNGTLSALKQQLDLTAPGVNEWESPVREMLAAFKESLSEGATSVAGLVAVLATATTTALEQRQDIKPVIRGLAKSVMSALADCELKAAVLFDSMIYPHAPWWKWPPLPNPLTFGNNQTFTVVSIDVHNSTEAANTTYDWLGEAGVGRLFVSIAQQFETSQSNGTSGAKLRAHFDYRGDGIFALFSKPADAVDFVFNFQSEQAKHQDRKWRIGVATGEVHVHAHRSPTGAIQIIEMVGAGLLDAFYCQQASVPGRVVVCEKTHNFLDPSVKVGFEKNAKLIPRGSRSLTGYFQLHDSSIKKPRRRKVSGANKKPVRKPVRKRRPNR